MIRILFRILVPILTLFLIIRTVFQVFSGNAKNLPKKKKKDPNVIDICPECGNVRGPKHKCF